MVDEERLEALDSMLWVCGSHRAALVTHANQSTVIRRAREVLSIFGGTISRDASGWRVLGSNELLPMERCIHQGFRFLGRRPLRLHAPYWSSPCWSSEFTLALESSSWICNRPDNTHACENPLELLGQRIIDACLLTPTQLEQIRSGEAHDLVMIPIYTSTIELLVWPELAFSSEPGGSVCRRSFAGHHFHSSLQLFPFLPDSCKSRSLDCFDRMLNQGELDQRLDVLVCSGVIPASSYSLAFLTPEMQRPLAVPYVIDPDFQWPYTETLVFLAEHAHQPRMKQLVDCLSDHFNRLVALDQRDRWRQKERAIPA